MTSPASFEEIKELIRNTKEIIPKKALKLLVGNKADKGKSNVPPQEIDALSIASDMKYLETSAKDNHGLDKVD